MWSLPKGAALHAGFFIDSRNRQQEQGQVQLNESNEWKHLFYRPHVEFA